MNQQGFLSLMVLATLLFIIGIIGVIFYLKQLNPIKSNSTLINISKSVSVNTSSSDNPEGEVKQKETKKQMNPSKTLAFYYTSKNPIFPLNSNPELIDNHYDLTDNPFKVCFTGNNQKKNSMSYEGEEIKANIFNFSTQNNYELPIVGGAFSANSCTLITGWADDKHLLRKSCGYDISSSCNFDLIDVLQNTSLNYASSFMTGLSGVVDNTSPEWANKSGEVVENSIDKFVFSQFCEKRDFCSSIKIFKNLPDDAKFPYKSYNPIDTINTTNEMSLLDLNTPENKNSLFKKIQIQIGKNEYLIFDLNQAEVVDRKIN